MPDLIYNKEKILKLIEAQKNNPTLDTENRGVTFLYGLANGRISLTEDAKEIVPEYFDILRQSRHPMIKSTLEDAENAFNTQNTVVEQEPVTNVEEAPTLEADIPFTGAEIERFNGLLDKDNVDITSEEYAFMADIIARRLIQVAKAGEDTNSIQQQFAYLAEMAQDKINQVFDGDIASDEMFPDLVALLGTDEQKELLDIRTKALLDTGYQPIVEENILTSSHTLQDVNAAEDDVVELETSTNQEIAKIEDDVVELETSANQETAKIEDDVVELETSANQETAEVENDVTELETSANQETAEVENDVTELETSANQETAKIENDVVELEASTILSDVTTAEAVVEEPIISQPAPVKKEKAPKKSAKKAPAPKPARTGELPLDAIVYNSKKLAAMNAQELLDIAQRIEEVPNEKQKRRMKSAFRYFIVQKLDNPKKVNLEEAGLETLAQNFGTEKQRKMFSDSVPQPQAVVTETVTPSEPTIVILPSEDEVIVENHTEPKPEKKPEIKKKPAAEKKKAKEVKMAKTPWYKRYIVQAAAAVVLLASTVFAVTKNVFGSDKSSDNDNAPKTEVKTRTVTQPEQDSRTVSFNKVREAQEKAKKTIQAKKAAQAPQDVQIEKNTPAKQTTMLTKEDAKCAKRTSKFLKKIAQNHNISIEEAQQRLDNFVNSLELPQGVSSQRMGYLVSIHALFPNSEFGITANKVFDGETIHVSKKDITRFNEEFSKPGDFGHKNNKYNTTLQVAKNIKANVK